MENQDLTTKKCRKCEGIKDKSSFAPSEFKKNNGKCKVCAAQENKEYREKAKILNKEKFQNLKNHICFICEIDKDISEFTECHILADSWKCKECVSKFDKKYKEENNLEIKNRRKKISTRQKEEAKNIIEKICKECNFIKPAEDFTISQLIRKNSTCKICVAIYMKKYHAKNEDKRKKYKKENKEKIKEGRRRRYKNNFKNNPIARFMKNISNQVNSSLKERGGSKGGESFWRNVPYIKEELMAHIIAGFSRPENLTADGQVWMTLKNYGKYITEGPGAWNDDDILTHRWSLDHEVPLDDLKHDSFDHPNFKKAWSLENLRPYSAKQNVIDGVTRVRHKNKGNK